MAYTGAKTDLLENLILNRIFNQALASTISDAVYIGLVTGNPTVDDPTAATWHSTHEVADSIGYGRVRLNAAVMSAAVTGVIELDNDINFGTGTATWGNVTGFIISTGLTPGDPGTYYYGTFDTMKGVDSGDSVRITSGNLTIEER